MYGKLAGMTGTADTEAFEFQQIYHLETVVIPTHQPMVRKDENDLVFRTFQEKVDAITSDIKDCFTRGQPVLVGTTSIENSELLSKFLDKEKLSHQVLNAKQHAREAEIIAQAGKTGAITIATNMAGRGTDIVLGGTLEPLILKLRDDETLLPEEKEREIAKMRADWQVRHDAVVKAGGLHIVGTERHESRRIDNQLRGRAGRQGDPGSSRFYLSLEDPLLRIFGCERLGTIMQKLKMPEGEPIEHPIVNRSIAKAQNRVESRNFDIRKQLLEYDDVANDQRRVIYQQRNELLEGEDIADTIRNMVRGQVEDTVKLHVPPESVEEQWDVPALTSVLASEYQIDAPIAGWMKADSELTDETMRERIVDKAEAAWRERETLVGPELMRQFERSLMLQTLDHHWRDHLALDHCAGAFTCAATHRKNPKQGIQARGIRTLLRHARPDQTGRGEESSDSHGSLGAGCAGGRGGGTTGVNVKYQHAGYDEALAARHLTAVALAPPPPFTRAGERSGATTLVPAVREEIQTLPRPHLTRAPRCQSAIRRPLPIRCCLSPE